MTTDSPFLPQWRHLFELETPSVQALLVAFEHPTDALEGQRVLLFGGARGIGRRILEGLLHLGATVCVVDIRPIDPDLKSAHAGKLDTLIADLTREDEVLRACQHATEALGQVDVLINNAAYMHQITHILDMSMEDWDATFALNTRSAVIAARQLVPGMLERGHGTVVFQMSLEGAAALSAYCASKAALRSTSFSLAAELPEDCGVHVFSFAPGLVATELVHDSIIPFVEKLGADFETFVHTDGKNPGYKGMMPPEHTAAGLIDAVLNASMHHGLIVDGLAPLHTAGIIAQPEPELTLESDHDAAMTSNEHMIQYVSGVSDLNRRIENRVQHRTRHLEQEREELHAQKMESLGVLAAGIAHDFNNLLVGIVCNLEMALEDSPESAREFIQDALGASGQATRLVKLMLDYSGKGQFESRDLQLNHITRECARLAQTTIPSKIDIQLELAPQLPEVMADEGQLQQIVMNLILNASEAIEAEGTITVRSSMVELGGDEARFATHTQQPLAKGRYVLLDVQDTGHGICPEKLGHIFDPFFTTKFTGRGLGLSAVLGIVRGHGGGIAVDSVVGKGTSFTVALPVSPNASMACQGPPRALIIDDDPMVRKALGRIIERQGHEAITAKSGLEGLNILRGAPQNIQVVFLDLIMPEQDGHETMKSIHEVNPDIPVILMSGYSNSTLSAAVDGSQFTAFIKKPFTIQQIKSALHQAHEGT